MQGLSDGIMLQESSLKFYQENAGYKWRRNGGKSKQQIQS
jgi:hypothetical protein